MDIFFISLTALVASCLTLFSGFGLGTLLMPVFAIFFPLDTAIAMTAVIHFLNNILKVILLWKHAAWKVVLKFGIPALILAFAGAKLLFVLEKLPAIGRYDFFGKEATLTPVKLTIAVLIMGFVVIESLPRLRRISFPSSFLPFGGALSGFFGGLSGHQGALRSMFLIKSGLSKESFIATGVVIACLVDAGRIGVYADSLSTSGYRDYLLPMAASLAAAFAGVFIGTRFMKKVTMSAVQGIVSGMLILIALLLGGGII